MVPRCKRPGPLLVLPPPRRSEVEAIARAGELVLPKRVTQILGPRAQVDHLCDSFEFAAAKDLVVANLDGWNPGLFGVAGSRTPVRGRTREVSGKKKMRFFCDSAGFGKREPTSNRPRLFP